MAARIELAKIVTSSLALVVPSTLAISELIQSGRYVSILDHFEEILNTWGNKHLDGTGSLPVSWVQRKLTWGD